MRTAFLLMTSLTLVGCFGAVGAMPDAAVEFASDDAGVMTPVDSGTELDAGQELDAGTTTDAGTPTDAGTTTDAGTPTDAGTTTDAGTPGCWPFTPPALTTLRASPKKVFAHYFSPFPLSFDNKAPALDYYSVNYLQPSGENGAFAFAGGYLKDRPVSRATPWPSGTDYELENFKTEVRRAQQLGLDGFAYDVLSSSTTSAHWKRLQKLLDAAAAVDSGFKILLVPDMTALGNGQADSVAKTALLTVINAFGTHAATLHLPDGRLALAPFDAEGRNAAFWNDLLSTLQTQGKPAALMPMTIGSWSSNANKFNGVTLWGSASWGVRTSGLITALQNDTTAAYGNSLLYMAAVAPQDSRPKNLKYVEPNTDADAFLAQWNTVITSGADWVQLVTWNDYSEDSHVAPSVNTGTAFFDLSAWFIARFKTGTAPAIERDALYWFHRKHSMNPSVAMPDLTKQSALYTLFSGPNAPTDRIQLVALLTAPATLRIEVGGQTFESQVGAGLQKFDIALREGTPVFKIVRNGTTVLTQSSTPISNTITFQNPLIYAGALPTCPVRF